VTALVPSPRLVEVAFCLVVSLALPDLLIAFVELQPGGPPADGIHFFCTTDTSPSYPTLMIVVGALTLLCLCCDTSLGKTAIIESGKEGLLLDATQDHCWFLVCFGLYSQGQIIVS
jgi:hypothetical protein